MKGNFLNYIHNFRGLTIVLIVGVHCREIIPWPEPSAMDDLLYYGLDFATILFVFISGFLFNYLNAEEFTYREYQEYLSKKFLYVILPFIIVSVPAILDKLFIETHAAWMTEFYHRLSMPLKIVYMLFTGKHSGPFYFIPMIGVIFLLAPLFHVIQKSKLFTPVVILSVMASLFSFHYGYFATLPESLVYFIPVYLFGMWVSAHKEHVQNLNVPLLLLLVFIYLLLFYLEWTGLIFVERPKSFGDVHFFYPLLNWGKLRMLCLSIILLNLFYRLRNQSFPLLTVLGTYSFGIYFIHIYFINIIAKAIQYFQFHIEQNFLIFTLYVSVVVGASMVTVFIVKKIFGKNSRLLVGS